MVEQRNEISSRSSCQVLIPTIATLIRKAEVPDGRSISSADMNHDQQLNGRDIAVFVNQLL